MKRIGYRQEVSRIGTSRKFVDAASRRDIAWHHINWRQANKAVKRLQLRIVQAQEAGDHRKVRALQHLLTRSFSASALAVRKVTENKGKKTAGIDNVLWRTNRQKTQAVQAVRRGQYRAKPLRRIYIKKPGKSKEKRPLSIPCMIDRAKQALYLLALEPLAEYYADKNSFGFRKGRSAMDAIAAVRRCLQGQTSAQWVLKCDIHRCFDKIDHTWLLRRIPMDKSILAQWLKAGYMELGYYNETVEGTPQGGIISPTLMNLTLDGLEDQLKRQFKRQKVHVIRYADDILITGITKALLEDKVKPSVETFLAFRGLTLSETKTHIIHVDDGINFLGLTLRRFKGKLKIRPAKDNVRRVKQKIKAAIKSSSSAKPEAIIRKVNPIIRGWSNYYRYCEAGKTFSALDHYTWQRTWFWAMRRHPNKGKRWVKKKYYRKTGYTNWAFSGTQSDGTKIKLLNFRDNRIKLYLQVKTGMNACIPAERTYLEERKRKAGAFHFLRQPMVRLLWTRQKGNCPLCSQPIDQQTGWHMHHVIRRCDKGKTHKENLVLLHPTCHEQWHQRDYETWAGLNNKAFKEA